VREHLGDEEDLFAAAGNGLADNALGGAVAVHLGAVDVFMPRSRPHRSVATAAGRSPFSMEQVP
jgi:hypothetical protein